MHDVYSHLSRFPDIAANLDVLRREMLCLAAHSAEATLVRAWAAYGLHAHRYLPLSLQPILEPQLLGAGTSVGWHRAPSSITLPNSIGHADNRLLMGHLVHATKRYDELSWDADVRDIQAIGHLAACALGCTRFHRRLDVLAAVPTSRAENALPLQIAKDVAFLTHIPHLPADALTFSRSVEPVKRAGGYWKTRATLHRSMRADSAAFACRHVLVIDDVCRTGATLHEAARACLEAGAASVSALTISKTFEFQRPPATPDVDMTGMDDRSAPW